MLTGAISHSSARATRSPYSTARRLTTGRTPGIPAHTGHTAVLGSARVTSTTGQAQNIFDWVSSSACTSTPITASKSSIAESLFFYLVRGAFFPAPASRLALAIAGHKAPDAIERLFDLLVSRSVG